MDYLNFIINKIMPYFNNNNDYRSTIELESCINNRIKHIDTELLSVNQKKNILKDKLEKATRKKDIKLKVYEDTKEIYNDHIERLRNKLEQFTENTIDYITNISQKNENNIIKAIETINIEVNKLNSLQEFNEENSGIKKKQFKDLHESCIMLSKNDSLHEYIQIKSDLNQYYNEIDIEKGNELPIQIQYKDIINKENELIKEKNEIESLQLQIKQKITNQNSPIIPIALPIDNNIPQISLDSNEENNEKNNEEINNIPSAPPK
jgi:hypothetical protein